MNASTRAITAALAVTSPAHVLFIVSSEVAVLVLLVYIGIALPAIWSAKPPRRKAAAAVLHQVLNALTKGDQR
jgi:hypothetical protein